MNYTLYCGLSGGVFSFSVVNFIYPPNGLTNLGIGIASFILIWIFFVLNNLEVYNEEKRKEKKQ